jgi:hypothetical protein
MPFAGGINGFLSPGDKRMSCISNPAVCELVILILAAVLLSTTFEVTCRALWSNFGSIELAGPAPIFAIGLQNSQM